MNNNLISETRLHSQISKLNKNYINGPYYNSYGFEVINNSVCIIINPTVLNY